MSRRVVVFGGTRGLGLAVARRLVADGAAVLVASRRQSAVDEARAVLESAATTGPRPLAMRCDVSRPDEVAAAVDAAVTAWDGVDGVVNSAGVIGPIGPTEAVDWPAWRSAIEINLFGAVFVARAVIDHFRAAGAGKLVFLSGGGATRPLPGMSSYGASKAALVRLVETLAEEWRDTGVDVNAVAPGPLDTEMMAEIAAQGPEVLGPEYFEKVRHWRAGGATPVAVPVALITHLLSPASDGIRGRLISAVWDPWRDPAAMASALRDDDMFTLRRVDFEQVDR